MKEMREETTGYLVNVVQEIGPEAETHLICFKSINNQWG
jgi:hypothetical protein